MHWKYLRYLVSHKWYVAKECWKIGIYWHAISHDMSKFRPSEWGPYARYFYGQWPPMVDAYRQCPGYPYKWTKEGIDEAFDQAWLLHQKRNKHHWQYYVLLGDSDPIKALRMPDSVVKQMACDWEGASKAIRGPDAKSRDYYGRVRDKTTLHAESRRLFEQLIGYTMDI